MSVGSVAAAGGAVVLCLVICGCAPGSDLELSCEGEAVRGCRPRQLVELRSFSVDPAELRRDDVFADLVLRAELGRCEGATASMVGIRVEAEYEAEGATRVLPLFSLADDGTQGDSTAADGTVEKTVQNPFTGMVPVGPVTLRGRAYSPSCESEPEEAAIQLLAEPR